MTDWCSWWFEGSWSYCCYEHDMTSLGALDWASHWALAQCVSDAPNAGPMGVLMFLGLILGGPTYGLWKQLKGKK